MDHLGKINFSEYDSDSKSNYKKNLNEINEEYKMEDIFDYSNDKDYNKSESGYKKKSIKKKKTKSKKKPLKKNKKSKKNYKKEEDTYELDSDEEFVTIPNEIFKKKPKKKKQDNDCNYNKLQHKFIKSKLQQRHGLLNEISKVYKGICNLMEWYRKIIEKIQDDLCINDYKINLLKLIQSTLTMASSIKVLFDKNFGYNSVFIISNEDSNSKGYYITHNSNRVLTSGDNISTKLFYVDGIKFYDCKKGLFKFSLLDGCCEEYIVIKLGAKYTSASDNSELNCLLDKVFHRIDKSYEVFNAKYVNVIGVLNSLAILIQNY